MDKSCVLASPQGFETRTPLMLQKLTLPLSEEGVLSSAAHTATTPYLCTTLYHVVDVWPLPTNHCATLMLHLCYY